MKLPFDLGVKLFLRMLLPGFFLALGLQPLLFAALDLLGYADQKTYVFGFAILLVGWLIVAADMPIYMLLEGRRFWPSPLWFWFYECERRRLERINRKIAAYQTHIECQDEKTEDIIADATSGSPNNDRESATQFEEIIRKQDETIQRLKDVIRNELPLKHMKDILRLEKATLEGKAAIRHLEQAFERKEKTLERNYLEASVDLRSFPLDGEGERYAAFPTRLGNTLTSFENYADTRYGIDDVFYWPRIWVNLSKELRDELDNQQAMADSTVYSSFALASTGLLWAFYGLLHLGNTPSGTWLYRWDVLHSYIHGPGFCLLVSGASLILAYAVYRLSLFTNEQYGNLFMAVIDTNVPKLKEWLDLEGIERKITVLTNTHLDDEEKYEVVRSYLQYYNVWVPRISGVVPFPKVKARLQEAKKTAHPGAG